MVSTIAITYVFICVEILWVIQAYHTTADQHKSLRDLKINQNLGKKTGTGKHS